MSNKIKAIETHYKGCLFRSRLEARWAVFLDRIEGKHDATVKIDSLWWEEHQDDEQRNALLDHETHHLVLARDEDGKVKYDDAGRPKLKMRQHDMELGLFWDVIQRHGEKAVEVEVYKPIQAKFRQMLLFEET